MSAATPARWCRRQSTSQATCAPSTSPTTTCSPSRWITPSTVRAIGRALSPHQHRASTHSSSHRFASSRSRRDPRKSDVVDDHRGLLEADPRRARRPVTVVLREERAALPRGAGLVRDLRRRCRLAVVHSAVEEGQPTHRCLLRFVLRPDGPAPAERRLRCIRRPGWAQPRPSSPAPSSRASAPRHRPTHPRPRLPVRPERGCQPRRADRAGARTLLPRRERDDVGSQGPRSGRTTPLGGAVLAARAQEGLASRGSGDRRRLRVQHGAVYAHRGRGRLGGGRRPAPDQVHLGGSVTTDRVHPPG